jgi:8-oxo-dGTP pyrophosphatase MutT (NUDIX family)
MQITKRETVFEGNHLKFIEKHAVTNNGENYVWETIERKNIYNGRAVIIVPLTEERELILERNWRAPLESFVIQFPAGLCDKENETEEDVARRELLEETGYIAGKLIPVITTSLCPATVSTIGAHFFAPDVKFSGRANIEIIEEIEVIKVALGDLDNFLLNLPKGTQLDLRVPGVLWIMAQKKLI